MLKTLKYFNVYAFKFKFPEKIFFKATKNNQMIENVFVLSYIRNFLAYAALFSNSFSNLK